jgi:hypothetical protein
LQPASHILVTKVSELFFMPGIIYPCFALLGRGM